MPVKDPLIEMDPAPPRNVREVGDQLVYRDFLTVGLLCNQLKIRENHPSGQTLVKDNWIYIQEPHVKVGRLQIFNNWSPVRGMDRPRVLLF